MIVDAIALQEIMAEAIGDNAGLLNALLMFV